MTTILIISTCKGRGSGAEVVLEELLRGWASREINLILLSPEESRVHHIANELGLSWYHLPVVKNGLHLRDNLTAVQKIEQQLPRCDAVVAWTIRAFPSADWLGRKRNVPSVGVLHDNPDPQLVRGSVFWDWSSFNPKGLSDWKKLLWSSREYVLHTWWRWQWAQHSANRFDRLVCVSEAVRKACVKKRYQCPLAVIRNGLEDMLLPERMPCDKVRIGFLGTGQPQRKGFSLIERWIPELKDLPLVWKLYGNASASTLDRIEKLQMDAEVMYCGYRSRQEIFSEIDVLVHASNLFDPLPTVLIEAARAGIPCLAASNGGAVEIVEDGVSGFVFDPKNPEEGFEKLKKLLDPQLRGNMGKAARVIFEQKFRVERMAREYAGFFEELCTK